MARRRPSIEIDLIFTDAIRTLEDDERGRLFTAILDYEETGKVPDLSGSERVIFAAIRVSMDQAKEQRERNRKNGRSGGRPKTDVNPSEPDITQTNPNEPKGTEHNPEEPKETQTNPKKPIETQTNPEVTEKEKGGPPFLPPSPFPHTPIPYPPIIPPSQKEKDICAEPTYGSTPLVVALPLNDGSEYGISDLQVQEWARLYPSVDVNQELRSMRGWLLANKTKRKTKSGILRFVNNWLAKEQNRSRASPNNSTSNQFLAMLDEEKGQ